MFDNEHRRAIPAQTVERLARLSHVVFRIAFSDVIEAEQKLFIGGRVDLCANRCMSETPFGFLIDDAKPGMAGAHELRQGLDEVHHVRLDIGAFCAKLQMMLTDFLIDIAAGLLAAAVARIVGDQQVERGISPAASKNFCS